jgi:hypothetical protein
MMRMPRQIGMLALTAALLFGSPPTHSQAPQNKPAPAKAALSDADKAELKSFSERAYAYIKMTRALPAGKLSPKSNVEDLAKQRETLRATIQQARPDAKQGDIFNPAAANVIRKLLHDVFTRPGGAKVLASLRHAEPVGPQDMKVNGVYPNVAGQPLQSVPPTILLNLPMLPKGLEYRISDHTLALRDSDANMVVDFLPDAIP